MSHVGLLLLTMWGVNLITARMNNTAHLKDDFK